MNTMDYFRQICEIPRESGNEDGIRHYILSWAGKNGMEAFSDRAGNVIVRCPASAGYENVPYVALQGHMDMVCVKTDDSTHDFSKDPIEICTDGEWITAKDTSLGADNGIAIAMAMALFTDKNVKHGPLEAVFTCSEETDMTGAFNLEVADIKSRRMINLDSEEDGIIYTGCAGGLKICGGTRTVLEKVPESWEPVEIKISGLKGGHSGSEIHRQRMNAINALARMLISVKKAGFGFRLASFDGGTRSNVIPSSASCVICILSDVKKKIMHGILAEGENLKREYAVQEPDFTVEHHCSHCNPELSRPEYAVNPEDSGRLVNALFSLYHGVYSMSCVLDGIVETSVNLATASLKNGFFRTELFVRSFHESAKKMLCCKEETILSAFGFETSEYSDFPSWAPDSDSELARFCVQTWKDRFGKEPAVTAIHAGLECGVINSRIEGMDSISIGPDLQNVHSVNERVNTTSVERIYGFLCTLLEQLAKKE